MMEENGVTLKIFRERKCDFISRKTDPQKYKRHRQWFTCKNSENVIPMALPKESTNEFVSASPS